MSDIEKIALEVAAGVGEGLLKDNEYLIPFAYALVERLVTHEQVLRYVEHGDAEPVAWNRGIRDSVDNLLAQAGYADDSSARHQLACMNFDYQQPQHDKQVEELEKARRSLQHDLTIARDERDQANAHWQQLTTWIEEEKNLHPPLTQQIPAVCPHCLCAVVGIPDGWKLVPRQLTSEMVDALTYDMWKNHTAWTVWKTLYDAAPDYKE